MQLSSSEAMCAAPLRSAPRRAAPRGVVVVVVVVVAAPPSHLEFQLNHVHALFTSHKRTGSLVRATSTMLMMMTAGRHRLVRSAFRLVRVAQSYIIIARVCAYIFDL